MIEAECLTQRSPTSKIYIINYHFTISVFTSYKRDIININPKFLFV